MRFKIIYLWFGLPFIIGILWFLAFYVPLSSFIVKQRAELESAKRTRETMRNAVRDILEVRKRDAQARVSLDDISKNMLMYDQFPSFMKSVTEIGKREGIVLDSLSCIVFPHDSQKIPSLITPALDMGLKGRFFDIAKFLEKVEKQKGFNRIVDGKVSYTDKEYPVLAGKFLVEFRAWKRY